MTTELEKQFFEAFGIEPKELVFKTMNCACGCHDCKNCEKYKNNFSKIYPQITDTHYLKLMCIYMEEKGKLFLGVDNIKDLKEYILNEFLQNIHWINKQEVQNLFIN